MVSLPHVVPIAYGTPCVFGPHHLEYPLRAWSPSLMAPLTLRNVSLVVACCSFLVPRRECENLTETTPAVALTRGGGGISDGDQARKGYRQRWGPGAQGVPLAMGTSCASNTISDGDHVRKRYWKQLPPRAQGIP